MTSPQLDAFASADVGYLVDLAPAVVSFWRTWRDSDHGRAAIDAATDIALAHLRAGKSRLFIDHLAWEIRARTGQELNNTARAPLVRYLMHVHPELRGCFATRATKKRTA